ncbi:hypothetical protein AB0M48_32460 [Lentzea sp. NPDC051208]|uniref:hypothetical protein n=1 Tax=Lentzea sp. NPDC051208 TaxID=3154642 RepID=UPI0034183092
MDGITDFRQVRSVVRTFVGVLATRRRPLVKRGLGADSANEFDPPAGTRDRGGTRTTDILSTKRCSGFARSRP